MTDELRGNHSPAPFNSHPFKMGGAIMLRGFCTRVVDGDTLDILIEGVLPHKLATERVRLAGIDTPETYGPNKDPVRGPAATAFVQARVLDKPVLVHIHLGKVTLNRVVADVEFAGDNGTWHDLATALREAGHAK